MTHLCFVWNPTKAGENLKNHKISFYEAASTFCDLNKISFRDDCHSDYRDERHVNIGSSAQGKLLFVVYGEESGVVRIITARKATRSERPDYRDQNVV